MAKGRDKTPEERAWELFPGKAGVKYVSDNEFTHTAGILTTRTMPTSSRRMIKNSYLSELDHIPEETWYIMYLYACKPGPFYNMGKRAITLIGCFAQIPHNEWQELYPGEPLPNLSDVPQAVTRIPKVDWQKMWNHITSPKSNFGKG
tara:strand:- start:3 stop:443 length:441 start_codon:yes stop_codon:yes gene_type:complete